MIVKPKKNIGQHFLTDARIAARIADSLGVERPDNVLELGPGTGALTRHLLNKEIGCLKLMEIDGESIEFLREAYPEMGERIIEADFLRCDLGAVFGGEKFALIGNFPYNISSQIFFRVLEDVNLIPLVCCMLQKEVAERLAAKPGGKTYGILSVLLQAYYDIEYLFSVPPGVFNPPPKVNSGVLRLTRNKVESLGCDEKLFRTVVKTAFNQRRKTLRNSLRPLTAGADLPGAERFMNKRAEELSVKDFIALTEEVAVLRG